jgi:hypothetical protein
MAHTIGPADPAWAQDHSRAPPRLPAKTPAEVEPLVGDIRPRLVTTTYAQGGVLALPWPRHPLGGAPWPEVWTIKRLLKRHGLVGQPTDQPRGTPYLSVAAPGPHGVPQVAWVGPRDGTGGQRCYGVQIRAA